MSELYVGQLVTYRPSGVISRQVSVRIARLSKSGKKVYVTGDLNKTGVETSQYVSVKHIHTATGV